MEKDMEELLATTLTHLLSLPAYTDPRGAYLALQETLKAPIDETPPTQAQWEKLMGIATNIRNLAPWEALHESEIVCILLPGYQEPVFAVTLGSGDQTYGICICPGFDSLRRVQKIADSDGDTPELELLYSQNTINLYFGSRDELEKKERDIIKSLGLKFRGKTNWPLFRSMRPGYVPWTINAQEAELAIEVLGNYFMAVSGQMQHEGGTDVDEDMVIYRSYDAKDKLWYTYHGPFKMPPFVEARLIFDDLFLINRLKKVKKSTKKLGFIATHMPMPYQEDDNQRAKFPKVGIFLDGTEGMIIDQVFEDEDAPLEAKVFDTLSAYITDHGRPSVISVPSGLSLNMIEDFVKKCGIRLQVEDDLLLVSAMLGDFANGMIDPSDFDNFDFDDFDGDDFTRV